MDTGLLLLRLAIGLTLAAHGIQKVTGGIDRVAGHFDKLGIRPARLNAYLAVGAELLGGLALAAGFLVPAAAAAIVATMVVAALAVHWKNGFFITQGGVEYNVALTASAAALAFTGPGRWSVDAAFGNAFAGVLFGAGAIAAGIVGAAIVLVARRPQKQGA